MADYEVVIVGGGPAGLTAGIFLARARRRVLLLEKEGFGGYIRNIDLIENYPGYGNGIAGAQLASQMVAQANRFGLKMEPFEVTGLELFSSSRYVAGKNGSGYTADAVIFAGGSRPKQLGVPGEDRLQGKGVFQCALCDGGFFEGKTVAVCGGGDSALSEALYMARIAAKVHLIHRRGEFRAAAVLQERVKAEAKIEPVLNAAVEGIEGGDMVEGVKVKQDGQSRLLKTDGVLVQVGLVPDTAYLDGIVPLDEQGQIKVNADMETEVPFVFAAGNIRSGSPRQVATAVGDGAVAALALERRLAERG
jgi:thioredoxin reductase (NADPH)